MQMTNSKCNIYTSEPSTSTASNAVHENTRVRSGRKMREQGMKVPLYKRITECKFLVKGAQKNRTLPEECQCLTKGKHCADGSCINRASSTECSESCSSKCKNRRIAKKENAHIEAYHTGTEKGCGLRATKDINEGQFIIEYVGEVLDSARYERRKLRYAANKKHAHFYFLKSEPFFIDATIYGNESRFANHSCDPNAICEKWVVPGTPGNMDRVGLFANRVIKKGEEITFDYQFHNYGQEAQKCYCGTAKCKGMIGEETELSSNKNQNIVTGETNVETEENEENLEKMAPHDTEEAVNDEICSDSVKELDVPQKFGKRFRSQSRSHSSQIDKRRKLRDRESPSSHYEIQASPDKSTPVCRESPSDRVEASKNFVKQKEEIVPQAYQCPAHPATVAHQISNYGISDPSNATSVTNDHSQMAQRLEIETLPTNEQLNELYERSSLEQLTKRLDVAKREMQALQEQIAKKQEEEAQRKAEAERAEVSNGDAPELNDLHQ